MAIMKPLYLLALTLGIGVAQIVEIGNDQLDPCDTIATTYHNHQIGS